MQVYLLKGKIHRALVTDANVEYESSLTVDQELMDKVRLLPYERVACGNLANSNRFETYEIRGKRGSREIILDGATAHLGQVDDPLTSMVFDPLDEKSVPTHLPRIIILGEDKVIAEECNI